MDAENTGILGRTLAEAGRDSIMPLVAKMFEDGHASGQMNYKASEQAAEIHIGLLIGDLQIRRAIGVLGPLDGSDLRRRSERALQATRRLFERKNSSRIARRSNDFRIALERQSAYLSRDSSP